MTYGYQKKKKKKGFYDGQKWKELRYEALKKYGRKCACCGAEAKDGAKLHVDHIKPRSRYRHLQYDINNLQILCSDCNLGKMNHDCIDYRK